MFGYDVHESHQGGFWLVGRLFPGFLMDDVILTDDTFDNIPVRIFRPPAEKQTGRGVLYYHGGGWVVGDSGKY